MAKKVAAAAKVDKGNKKVIAKEGKRIEKAAKKAARRAARFDRRIDKINRTIAKLMDKKRKIETKRDGTK